MKFSVVMPAYNAQRYIEEAVCSVLNQSYDNLELIVVDDGSQDDSVDILSALSKDDSRLLIVKQPNSGKPASARNAGLALVTGDVLTFLDADDLYHERRLEKMADAFSQGVNYVIHDVSRIDASGTVIIENCFERKIVEDYLRVESVRGASYALGDDFLKFYLSEAPSIHTSSIAAEIRSIGPVLFREDFLCAEDLIMWAHFIESARGVYINESLSQYRDSPDSLTKDRGRLDSDLYEYYRFILKKYEKILSQDAIWRINERMKNELLDAAYEYSIQGFRSKAISLSGKALLHFTSYKTFLAFSKSLIRPKRKV